MSGQILINYDEVYTKTRELRRRIETELREMDATYRRAQSALNRMDGKTNAALIETMVENRRKACTTAETLHKLLAFIDSSARQVERNEQMQKRAFAASGINTSRRGGLS